MHIVTVDSCALEIYLLTYLLTYFVLFPYSLCTNFLTYIYSYGGLRPLNPYRIFARGVTPVRTCVPRPNMGKFVALFLKT